jgi:excisionase family DNA binding protein
MKLLSVYEVSDLLGLDIDSVYRYVRQDILPAVYIGRRVKFSEEQINNFIENGGKSYTNERAN